METEHETNPSAVETFEGCRSDTKYIVPSSSVKSNAVKCVCIDDIVQFEKGKHRQYTCGGCSHKFITVCLLHEHLKLHGSGGSYHFDHVSNTAIPKYDTFCSFSQTDANFYDERADAHLASLTDEETSDHGYSDYEASDEPGPSLPGQEDKVSSKTSKKPDMSTKTSNVSEKEGIKNSPNKAIPLKIARVVLKDINDSIKDALKKGLSTDIKVSGHIKHNMLIKNSSPKPPRNERQTQRKQSKQLIKKLKGPEKRKATEKDPDFEIDDGVKKRQACLYQSNVVRRKKHKGREKRKPAKKPIDSDYEIDDYDDDSSDMGDIKQESQDNYSVADLNDASISRVTNEGTMVEIKQEQEKDLLDCEKGGKNCQVKDVKIKCDIAIGNKDDQTHLNKTNKVLKAKNKKEKTCDKCNKTLKLNNLKRHMMSCNAETIPTLVKQNPPWTCEICNKIMCDKYGLKVHLLRHAAKKAKLVDQNRMLTCEICKKSILKKMFKKHMSRHTSDNQLVMCEQCGQTYARKTMKTHRLSHLEVRPYPCTVCPAEFYIKASFELHMARHQGDRNFVCKVCGQRFFTKHNLLQHEANIHMGVKRFKCDQCEQTFFKKVTMKIHRQTHFEPTFRCKYCGRMFHDCSSMQRHERIHTGVKRYRCHICDHGFNQNAPYFAHLEKQHGLHRSTVKKELQKVYEANKRAGLKGVTVMLPRNDDSSVMSQVSEGENVNGNTCMDSAVDTSDMSSTVKVENMQTNMFTTVAKPRGVKTCGNVSVGIHEPRETATSHTVLSSQQLEPIATIQALQASRNQATASYTFVPPTDYLGLQTGACFE